MLKHRKAVTTITAVVVFIGLIASFLLPIAANAATTMPSPASVQGEHRKVNETAIRWQAPATTTKVSEYIVSLSVAATGKTVYKSLPATARAAYFGGILAGSGYEAKVKARYASGDSAYVSGGWLRASAAPRQVPAPAVRPDGADRLTATWSAPTSDEPVSSYTVKIVNETGVTVSSQTVSAAAERRYGSGVLAADHTYKVRVQARSVVGVSWPSDPGRPVEVAAVQPVKAFQPGLIISDANFYQGDALSTAQVQSFLNGKVSTCRATTGYGCLKDFRQDTRDIAAGKAGTCTAITGRTGQSAAQIITTVAAACGISPKTLLVLLQKEQGIVTSTNPSNWSYDYATGWGCPDTAECQKVHTGLFNQLYRAALQLKTYGTSTFFSWYPVGKVSSIGFHPNSACGASNVLIQNKATAALYYYTPYQPNAASLANPGAVGDACSSYGNRNFFNLFREWFGAPV